MSRFESVTSLVWILGLVTALFSQPALAEKPDWAGKEAREHGNSGSSHKKSKHENDADEDGDYRQGNHHDEDGDDGHADRRDEGSRIGDHDRNAIHDYYEREFPSGHCPPGLAKKHNGCMPPGLAKKWRVGHELPPDVHCEDLPSALVIKLRPLPPDYRYVRVMSDILKIAVGTQMVVDAVEDLGRIR